MMVMNIVVAPKPLYKVDEWLIEYMDGKAENMDIAGKYNDDRLGRCLQALFGSDRHSFMSEASVAAIRVHDLETKRIHNDSTTVSFAGAYNHQSPEAVQLKFGHNKDNQSPEAVQLKFGHNKDKRPDYKQIVFGLNITEDGHVPISYQAFDGNQADVSTMASLSQSCQKTARKSVDFMNDFDKERRLIGNQRILQSIAVKKDSK